MKTQLRLQATEQLAQHKNEISKNNERGNYLTSQTYSTTNNRHRPVPKFKPIDIVTERQLYTTQTRYR